MRPSLGGCIKSLRPPVSSHRSSRSRKVVEILIEWKRNNVQEYGGFKGHEDGNDVKIDFCAYLRQKWIDLRQIRTKMIIGPFYIYRPKMLRFCDICL